MLILIESCAMIMCMLEKVCIRILQPLYIAHFMLCMGVSYTTVKRL